jgi:hypothetical protein
MCSCTSDNSFLKDIDFSDGDYALFVQHKDYGRFIIDDESILKAYKNKIKMEKNMLDFLPGGDGSRAYALALYKNKKFIKGQSANIIQSFEINDILKYAKPVKIKSFYGERTQIESTLDSLKNRESIYLNYVPRFVANDISFTINFPSVAVPVKKTIDSMGYKKTIITNDFTEQKFTKELKYRILKKASPITHFNLVVNVSGVISDTYLFDTFDNGNSGSLKDFKQNSIKVDDYIFYKFHATFRSSDSIINQLSSIDFSDCMTNEQRLRPQLIQYMKKRVLESNRPYLSVENSEVGIMEYSDKCKVSNIQRQKYSLYWLEIQE